MLSPNSPCACFWSTAVALQSMGRNAAELPYCEAHCKAFRVSPFARPANQLVGLRRGFQLYLLFGRTAEVLDMDVSMPQGEVILTRFLLLGLEL